MVGGIFAGVLIAFIVVFNLFFNDDSKIQTFDRAIQSQLVVSSIADLASQYSESSSIDSLAATAKSVGVSNASAVSDIKEDLFGVRYVGEQPTLSRNQQELIDAKQAGNENEVAKDLMIRATEQAINELQTLEGETSSPEHQETIRQLRQNMSILTEAITNS